MTGYSSQPISQRAAKELLALDLGDKVPFEPRED